MKIVTLEHKNLNEKITYWDVKDIVFYATVMVVKFNKSNTVITKETLFYNIKIEEE